MLAVVGELVEDIVVQASEPVNVGSDTAVVITRRRGGSAANTAVAAAIGGHPARFIGRVGADPAGDMLLQAMTGVNLVVQRGGRTGTIVVLVDSTGERTMLPDPGSSAELIDPQPAWLDGVSVLHLPAYSLLRQPIGASCATLADWAAERGIPVTVDVSSVGLLAGHGRQASIDAIAAVSPRALLMNEDEADFIGADIGRFGDAVTVAKRGPNPATVSWTEPGGGRRRADVAAEAIPGLADSTGAGDAFAAGFLTEWISSADPPAAVAAGHALARRVLTATQRR